MRRMCRSLTNYLKMLTPLCLKKSSPTAVTSSIKFYRYFRRGLLKFESRVSNIARRSSAMRRQTTVRWQKQVFIHTRLSRAYLALARLSCIIFMVVRWCWNDKFCRVWRVWISVTSHCRSDQSLSILRPSNWNAVLFLNLGLYVRGVR